jgi:hypothetical protein
MLIPENYLDMVNKGDMIPATEISLWFDSQSYDNCDIMNAMDQLGNLAKKHGRRLVFRTEWVKGSRGGSLVGIKVLTDDEAANFSRSLGESVIRRIRKSLKVSQAVDTSKLDEEQKRQHQSNELLVSRRLLAMKEITRRTIEMTVVHQNRAINPLRRS